MELPPDLKAGYKNFSEFSASKDKYNGLEDHSDKTLHGNEWRVEKYEDRQNEGQYIAYKTLYEEYIENYKQFYIYLFRELDISNRARHPCTIELLSFDLHDIDHPVVVNKFYEYGSLADIINEEKFCYDFEFYTGWGGMKIIPDRSNEKGSRIEIQNGTVYTNLFYGIARALMYLHKLKIFHRDLKPGNIVIDEYFLPHISDFGYSKITSGGKDNSNQIGTPIYMAPEVMKGLKYSFPADIYSLGLIFYILTELELFLPKITGHNIRKRYDKYKKGLSNGIGLKLEMRSSNKLAPIINQMVLINEDQRPKIEDVVKFLEEPNHHFENTDEQKFQEYKNQIDNFENEQLPLIKDMQIQFKDEAGNLKKQLNKSKPSSNNNKKYHELQILLKGSFESDSEAECSLGIIFYTGYYGIPKDYATAWYYFSESHKHGNTQSKTFMTNILNEIVEEELKINNEHFSNISINNLEINDPIFQKIRHSNSQLILGMLKESETKYNESYNLYIKSIKQGNETAKTRLGILLYKMNQYPKLCETILTETSRWKYDEDNIKQTPERTLSLLYLGLLKQNRPESLNESIKIFEQLLSEDHPDAALLLGQCYEKKNDIPKAIKYYQLSFDNYSNESAKIYLDYYENLTKNKRKSSKK